MRGSSLIIKLERANVESINSLFFHYRLAVFGLTSCNDNVTVMMMIMIMMMMRMVIMIQDEVLSVM